MTMFRKIVTAIIVVPLIVIIVAFAVANRQAVTVSFDPLSSASPAYAATVPLFVLIFVVVIVGVLIGGIAAWIGQSKWRRSARQLDADVRALRDDIAALRRADTAPLSEPRPAPNPPSSPPLVIPPPLP